MAGLAGVVAMALLLLQPLLAIGALSGLRGARGRHLHLWMGACLVAAIVVHVGGLWITSPPDVVDALLFVSPTPFSAWGVVAMWAAFAAAMLVVLRPRLRARARTWLRLHTGLALIIVVGSVVHALLIEGTMGLWSKVGLCAAVLVVTAVVIASRPVWRQRRKGVSGSQQQ